MHTVFIRIRLLAIWQKNSRPRKRLQALIDLFQKPRSEVYNEIWVRKMLISPDTYIDNF